MITSKKEFDIAISTLERGASQWPINSSLYYDMGYVFEYGLFERGSVVVDIDYTKAFHWYEQGMLKGNLDATIRLADYLSEGIGCEVDLDKAICLYTIAIDKGSSIAANNLGTLYRDEGDYNEAFSYYLRAKELISKEYRKNTYSLKVAMCYLYGIGVEPDQLRAKDELEHIVSTDNDYSCQYELDEANYLLGMIYLQGLGVKQNINSARKYLLEADKEADHRSAQEILSLIGRS